MRLRVGAGTGKVGCRGGTLFAFHDAGALSVVGLSGHGINMYLGSGGATRRPGRLPVMESSSIPTMVQTQLVRTGTGPRCFYEVGGRGGNLFAFTSDSVLPEGGLSGCRRNVYIGTGDVTGACVRSVEPRGFSEQQHHPALR